MIEPTNPTNPIDWILRILIIFLFVFVAVPQRSAGPSQPPEPIGTARVRHVIESVDALVMESFPMQVSLHVKGYQPDGCELPVQVTQRREGNTVYVEIYRDLPADVMCPMVILPYEADIRLEGGFVNENYTVNVNDFILELAFGQPQSGQPQSGQPQPGGQGQRVPSIIESVEVGRYPSVAAYPAPLYLKVSGSHPDGCAAPVQNTQRREGNTVYVEVFRELPPGVMCLTVLTPFEADIPLEGGFDPGEYTFNVNGVVVTYAP